MNLNKNTEKSIIRIGASLIILTFALFKFSVLSQGIMYIIGIIAPFLIGGLIATIINVPLNSIEKLLRKYIFKNSKNKSLYRGIALLITLIIIVLVGIFVLKAVIPELINAIVKFTNDLPQVADRFFQWFDNINTEEYKFLEDIQKEIMKIAANLQDFYKESIKTIFVGGLNIVTSTFSFFITGFLAFSFAIYLLFYKERLEIQVNRALHAFLDDDKADVIILSGKRANHIFSNFLGGTFIEAIIFGIMNFLGMVILGLPYKTTISVLEAFMSFIPIFGAFMGAFIAFILIAAQNLQQGFIYIVMIIVVQQVESNIVYPRVVGTKVGLPGIWVLASVAVGGSLLGLLGMVLAVPIATLIYYTLGDIVEYKTLKKQEDEMVEKSPITLSEVMRKSYEKQVASEKD